MMTLLSSPKHTQYYKRDAPFFAALMPCAFFLLGWYRWRLGDEVPMYFITAFGLAGAAFFAWVTSRFVDEVYDLGDRLLIRNQGTEVSVALSDMEEVRGERGRGMLIVRLKWKSDTVLGRKASFLSEGKWNRAQEEPWIRDLKARISR